LDTDTQKIYTIHDDIEKMRGFYEHYKDQVWVGYNSRQYDIYIAKAILAGFNPFEISQWIIEKERQGWEFSKLLNKFPIMNYDCSVGFRSLKELEAFMGHDIQETSVPFDIDRPLTNHELKLVKKYNQHDVWETFNVFVETKDEFESHLGLIEEFKLQMYMINKTKVQLSAEILGANHHKRDDEFDIVFPKNLQLGKYQYIQEHFENWATNIQDYDNVKLKIDICGVPHVVAIGGLHGSRDKYFGDGYYILADAGSYYPVSMVKHNYLSRNVANPKKFEIILNERLNMKAKKDPREYPRKIVLNGTFGGSKDPFNKLYDPRQANGLCIANQLFLIDLLEKLEGHCEIIQSNTDGILLKLFHKDDENEIKKICQTWGDRTGFSMGYDHFKKIIQSNVNNYIFVEENGTLHRKGAITKELNILDNDLPIVNRAVVDYFVHNIPVEQTVMASNKLIDFQKITKISGKYEYGSHNGKILTEKVHRCFASNDPNDGTVYKKHKLKTTLDKTASTPEKAFIDNGDITEKEIPKKLDRQWYINLAKERIDKFV